MFRMPCQLVPMLRVRVSDEKKGRKGEIEDETRVSTNRYKKEKRDNN